MRLLVVLFGLQVLRLASTRAGTIECGRGWGGLGEAYRTGARPRLRTGQGRRTIRASTFVALAGHVQRNAA